MENVKFFFRKLFDLIFLTIFGLSALALFVPDFVIWLLTFWWDKRLVLLHKYSTFWGHFCRSFSPFWRVTVEGRENADKNKVYVIVCNHQSLLDIAVLYSVHLHFKWVAKKELAKVPVIGWNLYLNRYMLIDRKSFSGSKKMLIDGMKNLKMGNSLMIFPEGTRSETGKIGRFKDGAFSLALNAKVPILPVVVEGTRNVFASKLIKYRQEFKVKILPEIPYESYKNLSTIEIARRVNEVVVAEHRKIAPSYYV